MSTPKYFSLIKKLNNEESKKIKSLIKNSKKSKVLLELYEVVLKTEEYDKAKIEKKLSSTSVKYYNVYSTRLYNLILHFLSTENLNEDRNINVYLWLSRINIMLSKWLVEEANVEIKKIEDYILKERLDCYIPNLHELKYNLDSKFRVLKKLAYNNHDLIEIDKDLNHVRLNSLSKYFLTNMFDYINKYTLLDYVSQNLNLEHFLPKNIEQEFANCDVFPTNVNYHRAVALCYIVEGDCIKSIDHFEQAIAIYDSKSDLNSLDKIKLILTTVSLITTLSRESNWKLDPTYLDKIYLYMKKLDKYVDMYFDSFPTNLQNTMKQSVINGQLYTCMMLGDIKNGNLLFNEALRFVEEKIDVLKPRLIIQNNLNFAYFYYICQDYDNALKWNKDVLNRLNYKNDFMFTKEALTLDMIINFELENYELVESLNRSYDRYIHSFYPKFSRTNNYFSRFLTKAMRIIYDKTAYLELIDDTINYLEQLDSRQEMYLHSLFFMEWLHAQKNQISLAEYLQNGTKQMRTNQKSSY